MNQHRSLPTGRRPKLRRLRLAVLAIMVGSISCSGPPELPPETPYWVDDDMRPIPEPKFHESDLVWNSIKRSTFDQAREGVDLDRNLSKIVGSPAQASNINSYDEVPNSSWFTNRHGLQRMSLDELAAGRVVTGGPDVTGMWTVFRPKVGGATPGFWIEDSRGNQYIIKFDPIDNPEMATAAGSMGSRYFHACGYNVAEETIVYWRPEMLRIKDGATQESTTGKVTPFTQADLDSVLNQVSHEPDGSIRSLASLSLGNVKGPFSYTSRRKDDPNDRWPHKRRRELRGLYVIASFVNHYDAKDENSMDVYEGEPGAGHIKHYLMDFGSAFGSDGKAPKPHKKGYANTLDLKQVALSTVSLGMIEWDWEDATEDSLPPSVGYFESANFNPSHFEPIVPNPAFESRTNRDAYWGAKIVMAWRDDDLRALISSGQLSDPAAEEYLFQCLVERRDKIGRHWFGKVNPLENFELANGNADLMIEFDDLAIAYGLEPPTVAYECRINDGNETVLERTYSTSMINLSKADLHKLTGSGNGDRYFRVEIRTSRPRTGWSKPTRLQLLYVDRLDEFRLVKIEHID